MWVTNNYLPDGIWLLDVLGYRYVTNIAWVKPSFGLGQYFRGQHELLLFGVRKGAKTVTRFRSERKNLSSVLRAKKDKHSVKPLSSYDLIEARSLCPDPFRRLEMFARVDSGREKWDVWGNEV
jgi:N6-adenosine-specific RNA methylase IME4